MKIIKGTESYKRKNVNHTAIIEFAINNYKLCVFQGKLSDYDILIKYKKITNSKRQTIRTPKHIHWIVDLLMKLQGNKALTKDFLKNVKNIWNNSKPLNNNNFETLKKLVISNNKLININYYSSLNKYGEYDIGFLYILILLLIYQEKTNRSDSYLIGKILDSMLEDKLDIFKIISAASFRS